MGKARHDARRTLARVLRVLAASDKDSLERFRNELEAISRFRSGYSRVCPTCNTKFSAIPRPAEIEEESEKPLVVIENPREKQVGLNGLAIGVTIPSSREGPSEAAKEIAAYFFTQTKSNELLLPPLYRHALKTSADKLLKEGHSKEKIIALIDWCLATENRKKAASSIARCAMMIPAFEAETSWSQRESEKQTNKTSTYILQIRKSWARQEKEGNPVQLLTTRGILTLAKSGNLPAELPVWAKNELERPRDAILRDLLSYTAETLPGLARAVSALESPYSVQLLNGALKPSPVRVAGITRRVEILKEMGYTIEVDERNYF